MLTIKVYLDGDGQIKNVEQDFNLYRGEYQDKLLNLYVPTAILVSLGAGYSYAVKTACYSLTRAGQEVQSRAYDMPYVKTLTYQGEEYALFARLLPYQFTLRVPQAKVVFNVVQTHTYEVSGETKTDIINISTSGVANLDVQPSAVVEDEPIEPSDLDLINGRLNEIETNKQDKQDDDIYSYDTTPPTVVGALNDLDERASDLDDRLDTEEATNIQQSTDIASLGTRVATLEEQAITGITYIGTMTVQESLPTTAELSAFVTEKVGRSPKNGDKILVVVEKASATDETYDYIYGTSGWSHAKIPPVESAKNGTKGLVQGTYGIGSTADTLVDIQNGSVVAVYIKDSTSGTYRNVKEYINALDGKVKEIIDGTQKVAWATKATNDGNNQNIVSTYLTKTEGATKSYVKGYALPKTFNDVLFLKADSTYSTEIPSAGSADIVKSGIGLGSTQILASTFEPAQYEFELSAKNSCNNRFYISFDKDEAVSFRLTTYLVQNGGSPKTASIVLSDTITFVADEEQAVEFASIFTELGEEVVPMLAGSEIRQKLEIIRTSSATASTNILTNSVKPSSLALNTQAVRVTVYEGALVEYDSFDDFPEVGESGIIYLDKDANVLYRWDVVANEYLRLMETVEYKVDLQTTGTETVAGESLPILTDAQLTQAYNGIVAGQTVTIANPDGDEHIRVLEAFADDNDIQIIVGYKDKLFKYSADGDITVVFNPADKQDKIDSTHKLSSSLIDGLADVATSGDYDDLSNKPTIPTVNNGTLTIQKNGTMVGTFGANTASDTTVDIEVPAALSELTDDSTHRTVTDAEKTTWDGKQDELESGVNIKTVNGQSLLGSGNIEIQGGGGGIAQNEVVDRQETLPQATASSADFVEVGSVLYAKTKYIAWDEATITLSGTNITTAEVSGVTKYKIYDNNVYIGYFDTNGDWQEA